MFKSKDKILDNQYNSGEIEYSILDDLKDLKLNHDNILTSDDNQESTFYKYFLTTFDENLNRLELCEYLKIFYNKLEEIKKDQKGFFNLVDYVVFFCGNFQLDLKSFFDELKQETKDTLFKELGIKNKRKRLF